jgi:hypothetical protein
MRIAAITVLSVLLALRASASTLLASDNFESYNTGDLNKNDVGSINAAPNGSGNPWWGVSTGNFIPAIVTGATNGVTPHSGTQMVAGTTVSGKATTFWDNVAYRYHGGSAFPGNLTMTFWFYDPNGTTNGSNFGGNAGIAYYSDSPSNADYPSSQTLNNSTTIDRLSLGAASNHSNTAGSPQTFNSNQYQARVIGSTLGYNSNGWINLPLTRSVGWHEGEVVVGSPDVNGSDPVSFYIDNLTTPLLTTTTTIDQGYNTIEFDNDVFPNPGNNAGAYFDDVTLTSTPEPASLILFPTLGILLLRRRRRGE